MLVKWLDVLPFLFVNWILLTTNNPDQGSLGLLFCESGNKFCRMGDFKHPKCPWKTEMFMAEMKQKWVGIRYGIFMWNSWFSSSSLPTWYDCFVFQKNLYLTNQHRLKGEFVASLNIMSYEVALKFFHISTSMTICVCVFFISFRLSKRIQKYSVMSFVFNQEWLDETINPQFSSCVKPLKDPNIVLCYFCHQSFPLRNMGKRALESHEQW